MKDLSIKRDLNEENRVQDSIIGKHGDGKRVIVSMYEQNGEVIIADAYDPTKIYQITSKEFWDALG
jgi:hypothetical protein